MLKFINIECKEANEICNKAQYGEAKLFEKVKLSIHLATCKICSLYTKQNRLLTEVLKEKSNDEHCDLQKFHMKHEEKERLKEELKKQFQ